MEPKYKVGDLVVVTCDDGSKFTMPIDSIELDDYDRYIYHHKVSDNCGSFLYEEDIDYSIDYESDEYKEYQLYLKLKEKYG